MKVFVLDAKKSLASGCETLQEKRFDSFKQYNGLASWRRHWRWGKKVGGGKKGTP